MAIHQRLFLLLLILLPSQLGLHFWPVWAYILGRKVDYLSPTVYGTDIIILSVLVTWIIPVLKRSGIRQVRVPLSLSVPILAGTLFIVSNIVFASSPAVAMYSWGKVLELVLLGLYMKHAHPSRASIIAASSVGVLYSSWLAIAQFTFQHSAGGIFWLLGERTFAVDTPGIARFNFCSPITSLCSLVLRSYGMFPHPNVLGGFLATALPVMAYILPSLSTGKRRVIAVAYAWFVLISGGIALVLTFSRSAWITAALGFVIVILLRSLYRSKIPRGKKMIRPLSISLIVFFILLFISLTIVFRPFDTDESVVRRVALSTTAIDMWQHSPFIGVGLHNFLVELPSYTMSREINFLQPAHNIYLLLLSETGLIGGLTFAWIVVSIVLAFIGIRPKRKPETTLSDYIYGVPFVLFLLLGFIDHYPITLQQGQLWFTVLFALASQRENR